MQNQTRRSILHAAAAGGLAGIGAPVLSQSFEFKPSQRYPDPSILVLDPSFMKYHLHSSTIEQVATGMRWAEGPVYFPRTDGPYVLVSDIPNNRIMKFAERDGSFSVFRQPANFACGNARDRQNRLITCEQSASRRVSRTESDTTITTLAGRFEGGRLNGPNDIAIKSDGSLWFTDPLFGINGDWEGTRAPSEQRTTNVYRLSQPGEPGTRPTAVITDLINPDGIAFSPGEEKLYVAERHGTPNRSIWSFDVTGSGTVANKSKLIDAADFGALNGFKVDRDGNLWCGYGSDGSLKATPTVVGTRMVYELRGKPEDLDGVAVFNPQGKPIAFIKLPEPCSNLCFGGLKNNRLYMASGHSLYALYVEARGAI